MMFIIAQRNGRLCNRLFLLARLMAAAKEHNHTLVDLSLRKYSPLFDLSRLWGEGVYLLYRFFGYPIEASPVLEFLIRATLRMLISIQLIFPFTKNFCEVMTPPGSDRISLDHPVWRTRLQKKWKIYIFCDWWTLAPESISKHKEWVLSRLQPNKETRGRVEEFVRQLRDDRALVIGLVVRREDYESYMDGKYFFSMIQYRKIADRMTRLCGGKGIRFFICSIDNEDCSIFDGLDFVYRSGHPIENLYTLAKCDYLISPPSTYAMWASLVGSTPAYYAESPNVEFGLDDFSVMIG